ncbi:MAG: hypothetical protein A2017_18165 [Lentisphaerae bacterium GWF2_44_16]|nr:MAG: hypothetical protein A2017_18165 [Lentisphaerae bacterium GWF2_44_16]
MSTFLKESQMQRCKTLMVEVVEDLVGNHADEIVNTLNELYDSSPDKKAGLDVPVVLRVKRDVDLGYTFGGKIDIRKVERIKDERDPVTYNPNLPDLPGFEDGKTPEETAKKEEIEEPEKKEEKKKCKKSGKSEKTPGEIENLKEGDNGDVFKFKNSRVVDIVDYIDVVKELTPETIKNMISSKKTAEGKLKPFKEAELLIFFADKDDFEKIEFRLIRGGSGDKAGYFIQKLGERKPEVPESSEEQKEASPEKEEKSSEEAVPEPCGYAHKDGIRKCKKPAGHEGGHSYGTAEEAAAKASSAPEKKEENISLLLAKHGLSLDETEVYLRRIKKLPGLTIHLDKVPASVQYVRENIDFIAEEIKAEKEEKKSA